MEWISNLESSCIYKFKVRLIGTSVFLCLHLIFVKHILPDYHSFLAPLGFWFPYALFRLFVGYYAIYYTATDMSLIRIPHSANRSN